LHEKSSHINVGEIDTNCQFHQQFSHAFFADILKISNLDFVFVIFAIKISCKKVHIKMLVKSTPNEKRKRK